MHIFQIESFPIEQVRDIAALEQRTAEWFIQREFPARLLALSAAFPMGAPIAAIQRDHSHQIAAAQLLAPLRRAIDDLDRRPDVAALWPALADLPDAMRDELRAWCGQRPGLARLLSHGSLDPADWQELGALLDRALWRVPWAKEAVRFYQQMERHHLRSARYLLLTWEPAGVSPEMLAGTLRNAFGRSVRRVEQLPAIIRSDYREHLTYLEPTEPGAPYLALLQSYALLGSWDATTLHPLMMTRYDLALAVDITTFSRSRAQREAEFAFNAARLIARDQQLLDTRAERVTRDAHYVLHALDQQTLHTLQVAVLVGGESREELEVNVADARDRLSAKLKLMRPAGAQRSLLQLFSTRPTSRIEAPLRPSTQLSHAVGCAAGVIGFHRPDDTAGLFIGIDAVRRIPLFINLFANNQAAHTVVLGKSGYGKTVFLNLVAERAAAVAGMQVIGIDAFRNGDRVAAALGGARCYRIGISSVVNIFDVVYGADTEGGWFPNQVLHVVAQLALLLGSTGMTDDGRQRYFPRQFSTREEGVLDFAVAQTYQACGTAPDTPLDQVPTLSDLIAVLQSIPGAEAAALALDLMHMVYGVPGQTSYVSARGTAFNGTTTVDWNFGDDVVYYDFSQVPSELLPFYYLQAIGAINRYIRSRPSRARSIFLQIDEFGYAAQTEAVAQLAVAVCKTARKYGLGIMLVDQNPLTFLENPSGRQIIENCAATVLFHLEDQPARQMGAALPDLTPAHIGFLPQAQPGECLAVIRNDVYRVNVECHPMEARAFIGS